MGYQKYKLSKVKESLFIINEIIEWHKLKKSNTIYYTFFKQEFNEIHPSKMIF